jgi:hypothetical protein
MPLATGWKLLARAAAAVFQSCSCCFPELLLLFYVTLQGVLMWLLSSALM